MSTKGWNRRQFLESSAAGVAGAAALLKGAKGARAVETRALDEQTAATLLRMCRDLYPHDGLSKARYAGVVESLDAKAQNDAALAKTLREGIALLDSHSGGSWRDAAEGTRIAALKRIEDTPFFVTMRGETVAVLYNDPAVWRRLGYEGPSFPFGGYKNRGFNDLDWIDETGEVRK
jgi:hypothetical protein